MSSEHSCYSLSACIADAGENCFATIIYTANYSKAHSTAATASVGRGHHRSFWQTPHSFVQLRQCISPNFIGTSQCRNAPSVFRHPHRDSFSSRKLPIVVCSSGHHRTRDLNNRIAKYQSFSSYIYTSCPGTSGRVFYTRFRLQRINQSMCCTLSCRFKKGVLFPARTWCKWTEMLC